jgi:N-acetylglucosaminyl-diphospho-decaprenol L-rhamnosyltransferase
MAVATTVELSYCVVSAGRRDLLVRCLEAVAREREGLEFVTETLVLDNASEDGSAAAAASGVRVIAGSRRRGKPENANELLEAARGRYCLLLDDDAILEPGATAALWSALEAEPRAAVAGAALRRPDGRAQASAWRFPSAATSLAGALFVHRWTTVQSLGSATTRVGWVQSAAMLVRRSPALEIGGMDPRFFVYSDEVDFCRRLADAGWSTLFVPAAIAVHHEQLATGPVAPGSIAERRIVEFSRNRDAYMRKHHSAAGAAVVRWLTAWAYAVRALGALLLPGHSARRYWRHVVATLRPARGEGLREAAEEYNRGRSQP